MFIVTEQPQEGDRKVVIEKIGWWPKTFTYWASTSDPHREVYRTVKVRNETIQITLVWSGYWRITDITLIPTGRPD